LGEVAHGVAAAGAGNVVGKSYHIGRVMERMSGLHMSKALQRRVSDMLLSNDPVVVQQGIKNLRRARATEEQIRQITAGVSALGGANLVEATQ